MEQLVAFAPQETSRNYQSRRPIVFLRFGLGSARVSRAGDRVSRSRTFLLRTTTLLSPSRERLFQRDAETNTRDACATRNSAANVRATRATLAAPSWALCR